MSTLKSKIDKARGKREYEVPKVPSHRLREQDYGWITPEVEAARDAYFLQKEGEINAAAEAAVARFEAEPKSEYAFHLHHTVLAERLSGDYAVGGVAAAVERIKYVVQSKMADQMVVRLRAMRPIPPALIAALPKKEPLTKDKIDAAEKEYYAARNELRALRHPVDYARERVEAAWDAFHAYDATTPNGWRPGGPEALAALVAAATEWQDAGTRKPDPEVVAALEKRSEALSEAYGKLYSEWRATAYKAHNAVPLSSDDLWALHAQACEPDCAFTKDHPSVIPS